MKHKDKNFLDNYQKELIIRMFYGPYEDRWRDKNGIIDNRDNVIAQRMNIKTATVAQFLIKHLKEIVYEHDKRINKKEEDDI